MPEAKCVGFTKAGKACRYRSTDGLPTCKLHISLADPALVASARLAQRLREEAQRRREETHRVWRIQYQDNQSRFRQFLLNEQPMKKRQEELENEISKYRTLTRTMRFKEELMMFYWHPDRYDKWSFQDDD